MTRQGRMTLALLHGLGAALKLTCPLESPGVEPESAASPEILM